jgi:hypothetical protein
MVGRLRQLDAQAVRLGSRALFLEGEKIMRASKPLVPVFMGALRSSGHVQLPRRTAGGDIEVVLGYGGAAASYAVFVHEGTGPAVGRPSYFPPISALKPWARKKLGDENAAFAVARAIHRRGTKPIKFLEIPFRAALPGMPGRIAAHIRRGMR